MLGALPDRMIRIKCNWDPASSSNSETRVREKILPAAFLNRTPSQNWFIVFGDRFRSEVLVLRNLPVANRRAALENKKVLTGS